MIIIPLSLGLPLSVSLSLSSADSCTYTAVMNVNKTIPCNVPMCPDTPSIVLWCLMENSSSIVFNNNDEWEMCQ